MSIFPDLQEVSFYTLTKAMRVPYVYRVKTLLSCKDWEWGSINHDIEEAFIFYAHVYCMYVHGLVYSRRSCYGYCEGLRATLGYCMKIENSCVFPSGIPIWQGNCNSFGGKVALCHKGQWGWKPLWSWWHLWSSPARIACLDNNSWFRLEMISMAGNSKNWRNIGEIALALSS